MHTLNQKFGEVCPANWEEWQRSNERNRKGVAEHLSKN